jgi:lysophospholipid acyltransferase (LPLAT)-like uncharacterized protein
MGSWDRTQVPKPFSRVAVVIGKPFVVPDTSEVSVEAGRQGIEAALAASRTRAADILGSRAST